MATILDARADLRAVIRRMVAALGAATGSNVTVARRDLEILMLVKLNPVEPPKLHPEQR